MRRRSKDQPQAPRPAPPAEPPPQVIIPHDPVHEGAVIATMVADPAQRRKLSLMLSQDHFQVQIHREAVAAIAEAERRKLEPDYATLAAVGSQPVADYVRALLEARGPAANVDWHVTNVLWDAARVRAATGPLPSFIEALRDPRSEPERVRSLARAVGQAFDGHEDRRYLRDPHELVREMMLDIEERFAGRAFYPFGIDGIDLFDDGTRRLASGAAPGQVTVVTGVSGGGKSTLTIHLVLGLIGFRRQEDGSYALTGPSRRVLFGAWEMKDRINLELLAVFSLGQSRHEWRVGAPHLRTEEALRAVRERAELIGQHVRMLDNPFKRRRGEQATNERNLDLIQGYIADSGCDVFVADLWKRCLRADELDPGEEEEALVRQQAMAEEQRVHCVLLQQQRFKDIEMRADKRPTREGIKGSGAWVEVADNILAPHWPYLFKRVDPGRLELFVLKQRYGAWPLGIEMSYDAASGRLWGGRQIEYDRPGEVSEMDGGFLDARASRRRRPQL